MNDCVPNCSICKSSDFVITDEQWEKVKSFEGKQAAISIPRQAGKSAAFKQVGYLTNGSELFIEPAGTDSVITDESRLFFEPGAGLRTNNYSFEISIEGSAMSVFKNAMLGASQRAKIDNKNTNKEEENPMKDNRIEALERQVESLTLRIQKLARWGEDTYKDGTVLIVDKVFQVEAFEAGDETVTAYRYALVKIGAYWYITGQNSGRSTWAEVVDFFYDGKVINIEKVTKTKAILTDVTE